MERESRKVVTVLFCDLVGSTGRPLAHSYFAETLALAGKHDEALEHARTALEILTAKGNVMLAVRLRERLAAVSVEV
jgi:hypothetical protein